MKFLFSIIVFVLLNSCTISYPSGIIAEYPFNGNLNDYKLAEVAIDHGAISFKRKANTIGLKLTKGKTLNFLELPNIKLNPTEYTISLFINIKSFDHNNAIFFYGSEEESWGTSGLWLYTDKKKLTVFCENQFLTNKNYSSKAEKNTVFTKSKDLKENQFYFITLSYINEDLTLFVDAKQYAVYHKVKPFSTKNRKALIGIANDPNTKGKFQYEGIIDELKIFNKRLSKAQIKTLYNSYKKQ